MERIHLTTIDNQHLAGSYYPGTGGAGVVCLHQNSRDRKSYDRFAEILQSKGFHVVTVDFRGRGESSGNLKTEDEYRALFNDARAADEWLREKVPGVRVQMIGASIGANTALRYQEMNTLRSVILLSPSNNYFGIVPIDSNLSNIATPIFYLNSTEDNAVADTQSLFDESPLPASHKMLLTVPGKWHGVDIIENDQQAKQAVIEWILRYK